MPNYPNQRTDRPVPGMDVSADTREEAEAKSRGCVYCSGHGMATIYSPDFRGAATEVIDGRVRLLRSAAYCVCAAGRWMLIRHQQECKDLFRRTFDLYDVVSGRAPGWMVDDPRGEPNISPPADMETFPDWKSLVVAFGAKLATSPNQFADSRRRARENWFIRFLVNALESGPLAFEQLAERAVNAGRRDMKEMRTAADLARIKITRQDDQEIWALE